MGNVEVCVNERREREEKCVRVRESAKSVSVCAYIHERV